LKKAIVRSQASFNAASYAGHIPLMFVSVPACWISSGALMLGTVAVAAAAP
jgi:hypothetical protein